MPTSEQKLQARRSIQQALAFLQSIEQEAEKDQYREIPHLLIRLDGALFDLRQSLPYIPIDGSPKLQALQVQDPTSAAIQDEYEEDV